MPKLAKVVLVRLIRNTDSVVVGLARIELVSPGSLQVSYLAGIFEPQIRSIKVGTDAVL